MNGWRKGIVSLLILVSLSVPVCATALEAPEPEPLAAGTVMPMAEQKRWYYRQVDGKYQKRLWSITECKWLTDWIDC